MIRLAEKTIETTDKMRRLTMGEIIDICPKYMAIRGYEKKEADKVTDKLPEIKFNNPLKCLVLNSPLFASLLLSTLLKVSPNRYMPNTLAYDSCKLILLTA